MQVRDDYKTLITIFRSKLSESASKSMSNSTSTNAAKRKFHTNEVKKNNQIPPINITTLYYILQSLTQEIYVKINVN